MEWEIEIVPICVSRATYIYKFYELIYRLIIRTNSFTIYGKTDQYNMNVSNQFPN